MTDFLLSTLGGKHWRDILFADLHILSDKTPDEKRHLRDVWLREFLYSRFDLPDEARTGTLFFRSLVREDYKGLFHAVIEASGLQDFVVVEDYQTRPHPPQLNPRASRFMLDHADLFDVLDIDDPLDRACCFIRACKYGFILDHFRKMKFETLVCFADMQPVEHLLARYFRAQGVTTVTLQHGLYVDYGDMETVNVINYIHQPSEYFLSWGPETSDLIKRHHPGNKTVDCGKPLIFTADPPPDAEDKVPYIAVFLDQRIFNQQNEEMLEIVIAYARRSNRAVRVRFHPSINKKQFFERYPEIKEQLHFTDADFVVGHTSSLIYEAITLGCRVFQFESEIPAIALPDSCKFRTLQELVARQALPQPGGLGQRYFCATGDPSLRRYTQFFRETLGLERPVNNPDATSPDDTNATVASLGPTATNDENARAAKQNTLLKAQLAKLQSTLDERNGHIEYSDALKRAYKKISLGLLEELRHFVPGVQSSYAKIVKPLYEEDADMFETEIDEIIEVVRREKEKQVAKSKSAATGS